MAGNAIGGRQPDSKGALATAIAGLIEIIGNLPRWFQALVVVGVLAGAGWLLYLRFKPSPVQPVTQTPPGTKVISTANSAGDKDPYFSRTGQPSLDHPTATDLQTMEANHKSAEDGLASSYHQAHETEDDPPIVKLGDSSDPQNSLYYKYYEKTDKCLYINRTEGGTHWIQWVLDPQYHLHDLDTQQHARNETGASEADRITRPHAPGLFDHLLQQVVLADSTPPAATGDPVQAGFCVNPHPGQFRYWWGPPVDQCNSPMYRQFGDGCTHFQIFNRCSNAWNAQINWVTCNPPPHH